jgi:adenylate cyclase
MSDTTPAAEVIDTLNGFFGVLVEAVEAEGGEVLKFIGDALLAIFPAGADGETQAVSAAAASLARSEAMFAESPDKRIGFRAAIHFGEVSYGNIGGGDRLDFTAIGPSVNLASRLLSVAADTGRDLVCSSTVADHLPGCETLGAFALKGIATPQPIFAITSNASLDTR